MSGQQAAASNYALSLLEERIDVKGERSLSKIISYVRVTGVRHTVREKSVFRNGFLLRSSSTSRVSVPEEIQQHSCVSSFTKKHSLCLVFRLDSTEARICTP